MDTPHLSPANAREPLRADGAPFDHRGKRPLLSLGLILLSVQVRPGRWGEVSIAHYGVRVGGAAPLSDRNWLGLSLSYDREEYNFSNAGGFAVSNPWNQINRLGLGLWFKYRLNDQWSLGGGPIGQYAGRTERTLAIR